MDTQITIHTPDDGTLTAQFDRSMAWPTPRIGETISLTFYVQANQSDSLTLTVAAGETYTIESGDTEAFLQTTVEPGGTLTQEPGSTLITAADRAGLYPAFTTLRDYGDFAGAYWSGWDIDDDYRYREQLPSSAKSSLVIGVEPNAELREQLVSGVWGLVESVEDRRNAPLSNWRLGVTLRVLAPFDEYDSVSAVQTVLEA